MPQTNKNSKLGRKYRCSNPNCKRVFSRPKIIRYYVCPTCQTLIDMVETADVTEVRVTQATPKLVIPKKPKTIVPEKSVELPVVDIQPRSRQPAVEKQRLPTEDISKADLTTAPKQIHMAQQKAIEPAPTHQPKVETKTIFPPASGCQYGFGYLSQREKGEGIPDTCIECSRSLNCMLSGYYKSRESVKEIRKWYKF